MTPVYKDNFDQANSNSEWKDQDAEALQKSQNLLRRDSVQDLFNGYYYDESFSVLNNNQISQQWTTNSRNTAAATTTMVVR